MSTWEIRYDAVVVAAYETWTRNGSGLDDVDCERAIKSCRDAATNVWRCGMTDADWYVETLRRLQA